MANTQLTLSQQIERPEVIAKFAKTLGNDQKKTQAFLRSINLAVQANDKLRQADPMSVLSAAMVAASLDLEINQNLGYAAIVPYKGQAQFQIMTNGLSQLFFRSGQAKAFNLFIVYADEYAGFDKIKGELKPLKDHDDKCKEVVGYGCYLELINGFSKTEYWSKDKVKAHAMKYSQAYKNGFDSPWKSAFDQMAMKTVGKYCLVHYCPKTTTMQLALDADQSVVKASIDDDTFQFNYADNPQNSVETVQYSEEETKLREDTIEVLHNYGIADDALLTLYKVSDISLIPTEELQKRAEIVMQNAGAKA